MHKVDKPKHVEQGEYDGNIIRKPQKEAHY